jgi:hypothetical protein
MQDKSYTNLYAQVFSSLSYNDFSPAFCPSGMVLIENLNLIAYGYAKELNEDCRILFFNVPQKKKLKQTIPYSDTGTYDWVYHIHTLDVLPDNTLLHGEDGKWFFTDIETKKCVQTLQAFKPYAILSNGNLAYAAEKKSHTISVIQPESIRRFALHCQNIKSLLERRLPIELCFMILRYALPVKETFLRHCFSTCSAMKPAPKQKKARLSNSERFFSKSKTELQRVVLGKRKRLSESNDQPVRQKKKW